MTKIYQIKFLYLKKMVAKKFLKRKFQEPKKSRPELEKLLSQIRKDDTLVVCKLDRLARSTHHLLEIVETLREKKAAFCSLGEPWADTTSHAGKMIMTVFAGIAEFERDLIRERTSVGRKAAMKRGVLFGRPRKLSPDYKKSGLAGLCRSKRKDSGTRKVVNAEVKKLIEGFVERSFCNRIRARD